MARRPAFLTLATALCALALLLRAVLPAGWMPAAAAGGGVTIVVCTGTGPATAKLDLGIPAKSGGAAKDAPCGFAGMGGPALAAAPAFALALLFAFILLAGVRAATLPVRAVPLRLRPPPHGPPALLHA